MAVYGLGNPSQNGIWPDFLRIKRLSHVSYDARCNNLPMLTQHFTCIGRYTATVDTELYAPGQ